ncbi:Peptidase family M28 [Pustulibacterium marinum]|uniref:Vacuolar membrane protease n=1 Tax=Pustulibacterium marinum TaxID=1224947 RepID=A0A1I7EZW2_9FLAO|nr:M20/M25/M40 family metallo-hydrolase [Pustulibacterium marinum]SFU29429.1 Peptidase family M28 [Pustulibacterium marinum]
MKKINQPVSILIIIVAIFSSFYVLLPQHISDENSSETSFSTKRALNHVEAIASKPHFVGSSAHKEVITYLQSALENLGIVSTLQTGYTAGDWANLSSATNIIGKIEGSEDGKALLLLSHYDSNPHSSLGASDDAAGVATILESLRAFLAEGNQPKNDIIIVFSDAEELGLNGAQLFVNNHPWIKDVGLVLNFEARGSGGPSYMLIETNNGNSNMVKEFQKAAPKFPVANSFMYSIYKMLPNDTDLTVFREDANVNGFNFAFIDDHFDYHTQLDNYERLDRKTLEHQGSYLMPLLKHFSNTDLSKVTSDTDTVYFNVPVFKLISYPFAWILPMLILGVFIFIAILIFGKTKRSLRLKKVAKGFIPFILLLTVNGILGYFAWPTLKYAYPEYQDILHGFTYNGHWYIAAYVALSLGFCFLFYGFFHKVRSVDLAVAPLFFWLVITALLSIYLKGGAFFIIPFYAALLIWWLRIKFGNVSPIVLTIIGVPVLVILVPFVQMFPVGLGLKMMVASTVFVSLIYGLLLPVFATYRKKRYFALGSFVIAIAFLIIAHQNSKFTSETPKPSSLVYLFDADTDKGFYASYDAILSPWNAKYLQESSNVDSVMSSTFSSKYGTRFNKIQKTDFKKIPLPIVSLESDTIIGDTRKLRIEIKPQRAINRVEIFSDVINFTSVNVNGIALNDEFLNARKPNDKLITHYVSDNASTVLEVTFSKDETFEMEVYEAANDLLSGDYGIKNRPENEIPMPFVLNDATITKKKYIF